MQAAAAPHPGGKKPIQNQPRDCIALREFTMVRNIGLLLATDLTGVTALRAFFSKNDYFLPNSRLPWIAPCRPLDRWREGRISSRPAASSSSCPSARPSWPPRVGRGRSRPEPRGRPEWGDVLQCKVSFSHRSDKKIYTGEKGKGIGRQLRWSDQLTNNHSQPPTKPILLTTCNFAQKIIPQHINWPCCILNMYIICLIGGSVSRSLMLSSRASMTTSEQNRVLRWQCYKVFIGYVMGLRFHFSFGKFVVACSLAILRYFATAIF